MTTQSNTTHLPVAVIGAGPIGLAAAVHLLERDETPLILEAGSSIGTSIRKWGHVRFFSPWKHTIDVASEAQLALSGWSAPDPETFPTGHDIVERYLEPLAALPRISSSIRLGARVTAISRRGHDKMKTPNRADAPFVLRVHSGQGREETVLAKAVIDASGTYQAPNPLGADGLPAMGERAAAERIFYGIPDVLGRHHERYAGKRVLVVGSGHSAFNALLELADPSGRTPGLGSGSEITWAIRPGRVGQLFGGEEQDALPERGRLGGRIRALVEARAVRQVSIRITEIQTTTDGLFVIGDHGDTHGPFGEIVCATGFRPDLSLTRELRLDLDPAVEAPSALAPLIDPNVHSCGSVPPHGADQLKHPEPNFYTVGMKSYGRAPTFLLLTGYEQVRSVAAAIAGDWESARRVELVLPETGVCSTGDPTGSGGSCCDTASSVPAPTFSVPPGSQLLPVLDLSVSADLRVPTAAGARAADTATAPSTCCPAAEQMTCCEPSHKASCCGASHLPGPGCACR